jgi:hypothetical protein
MQQLPFMTHFVSGIYLIAKLCNSFTIYGDDTHDNKLVSFAPRANTAVCDKTVKPYFLGLEGNVLGE